ncbi:type I restriction endonuclease [Neisseria arctica]|nr:type I restriction endonuclease [Neisseria arctica]UOO87696.1 hypothetical protein LVJ86_03455 [Neisseria arctica]
MINQLTIKNQRTERRPDVVLFVNGLPLVVLDAEKCGGCPSGRKRGV